MLARCVGGDGGGCFDRHGSLCACRRRRQRGGGCRGFRWRRAWELCDGQCEHHHRGRGQRCAGDVRVSSSPHAARITCTLVAARRQHHARCSLPLRLSRPPLVHRCLYPCASLSFSLSGSLARSLALSICPSNFQLIFVPLPRPSASRRAVWPSLCAFLRAGVALCPVAQVIRRQGTGALWRGAT